MRNISSFRDRIIGKTNNVKLSKKFIRFYCYCMLIPVILIDTCFLVHINYREKAGQTKELEYAVETLKSELVNMFRNCVDLSNYMYSDQGIYDFLTREYTNETEYYDNFFSFQKESCIGYLKSIQVVEDIQVYDENPSIIRGDFCRPLEDAKDEEWFPVIRNQGGNLLLYYTNESNNHDYTAIDKLRMIQKMDNFGCQYEIYVVIDINFEKFYNLIDKQSRHGEIVVYSEGELLFSTNKKLFSEESFSNVKFITKNDRVMKRDVEVLDKIWTICVRQPKISLWNTIMCTKDIIIIIVIINILLPFLLLIAVERSLLKRVSVLEEHFTQLENEEFNIIIGNIGKDEIGHLMEHYNAMVTKVKNLIETTIAQTNEKRLLEVSKKQAELNALNSQINPHFMYNTLQCICMRSLIKGERETAEIVRNLSSLLRQMSKWNEDNITFSEEVDFVTKYLKIQKYRFAEKINYLIFLNPICKQVRIPKLSIVSFVENACVHGIEGSTENGKIFVNIYPHDKDVVIEIEDTGCGMNQQQIIDLKQRLKNANITMLYDSKSTGVLNAYIRLKNYFGHDLSFDIESEVDVGTKIIMKLIGGLNLNGED
ncbi:sensor histidine kinase [Anaeromicropila populeti]|uniref:Two-component system, sensor histidine kinase YesM n=1 Tax=Anaeromicropila populeti TaxID=37658 RepID=A0A1I6K5A0_9FIRM|nr:histidine kinase [Anaeromicropila populeti]SFR86411.1 two-component system, sensor histidine kinase YesM [Anaeromicropila populeti]